MSVTQAAAFWPPNTDNLQEFAENTAVSKAGRWHHQECVEMKRRAEVLRGCFLVAGSSSTSHHRSKFTRCDATHVVRSGVRWSCCFLLIQGGGLFWWWLHAAAQTWSPNIVHRGGFYHVLWHHWGSHVAVWSLCWCSLQTCCVILKFWRTFCFLELMQTATS